MPAEPAAGDLVPSPADVAAAHRHRPRGPREAESTTAATADPDDVPATSQRPATSKRSATSQRPAGSGSGGNGDRETERGLRGLVGSGSSQVGVWAAARARDAARPSDEELRRADEELAIVRRNWVPREPFRPGSKP